MSFLRNLFWNVKESRLRAGWRLLIQLIVNMGLYLLFFLRMSQLWMIESEAIWPSVIMAVSALGITLVSVWFGVGYLDRRRFSDLGLCLSRKEWWLDFGFGVLVGVIVPAGFVFIAHLIGWLRLEVSLSTGVAGVPLVLALLLAVPVYLSIGTFEEVARVYHLRNLFEGTRKLGVLGAMVLALSGASAISVIMHDGNAYFLLFVFVSTAFHGLAYFLTGRAALAMAHHAAWDFTLIVLFGFGEAVDSGGPTIFQASLPATASVTNFTPSTFLVMVITEIVALGLVISWVRWRYGKIDLHKQLTQPFWQYAGREG